MTRLDEIRDLYAYDQWANRRILAAVGTLPAEAYRRALVSSFPSIRDTLEHALAAAWVWLERWKGVSPTGKPEAWSGMDFDALLAAWSEVEAGQRRFVAALEEADLDRVLDYRDTAGRPFSQPVGQLLRHVVNHGTYHRGQVATLLRQVGAQPPSTDMVVFHREQG